MKTATTDNGSVPFIERTPAQAWPELIDPVGKFCDAIPSLDDLGAKCGHPAYAAFSPFAGRYYGFKCACCFRKMWKESVENLMASLANLPDECLPR